MTAFLTIFRRFPKIFQNCSEGQTNVPEHFPRISENSRRCPKISEDSRRLSRKIRRCFDDTPTNLSTIKETKLISEKSSISSHVKISYLTLNDWSRGEQWILFPENLNVSRDEVEGNIEIRGKQNSLFPKGPVIKWFVIKQNKTKANFEKRAEIPATAVNISRVTVNCFPFDVIVFAMLPAQGIWRETVSLLDVMWPWISQWKGTL